MGTQTDESDEVLSDQHPSQGHRTVSTVVVTTQCRTPCLCVVGVDTGKDRRVGSRPVGIVGRTGQSRFH